VIWLTAFLDGKISSRLALWSFANTQAATMPKNDASKSSDSIGNVDFPAFDWIAGPSVHEHFARPALPSPILVPLSTSALDTGRWWASRN